MGNDHGASVSFFLVRSAPGQGADKHRHPYEEIFVNLGGSIEVTVGDESRLVEKGTIVVVPAGAWHGFKNRSGVCGAHGQYPPGCGDGAGRLGMAASGGREGGEKLTWTPTN